MLEQSPWLRILAKTTQKVWKQLGDLMESIQKRSPCSRIFQDPALDGWHKAAGSHTCQQDSAFPGQIALRASGGRAGSLYYIRCVTYYRQGSDEERAPVFMDSPVSFRERKGNFEKRQKKKSMDGTVCSLSLEGSKCYFKGVPENFTVQRWV